MTSPDSDYDIAIVGAGFAGLYLLHRCRTLGFTARIWEAGEGVGGTWYWNRYPGARCDIESMQYSYQFDEALQQEWEWSERYATQPEILCYAEHVADRFALLDGIDFGRRVSTAQYNESAHNWTLSSESGESLTARFCIMATGCLSSPNWPSIDGYDKFEGKLFHTGLWPHDGVDFNNKRVVVIGTGSSGIQSIPLIAADADHLTVCQRTPNYSVPAHNAPSDPVQVAKIKNNYSQLRASARTRYNGIDGIYYKESAMSASTDERQAEYEKRWATGGLTFFGSYGDLLTNKNSNDTLVEFVHAKICNIVDDQTTAKLLCPNYLIGGKRLCVDTDYYATYNRENVSLVDIRQQPITAINADGVQIGETQYFADIIVVATGFDAITGSLTRIDIRGLSGVTLKDRWQEGASGYLGLAMNDYPNLFTVTGPGSPSVLTNMLPTIEQHVEWITDCISYMRDNNHRTIEATMEAEQEWWQQVQNIGEHDLRHSTTSWYTGANLEGKARGFIPYSGGFPAYCEKCREVVDNDYTGFNFS